MDFQSERKRLPDRRGGNPGTGLSENGRLGQRSRGRSPLGSLVTAAGDSEKYMGICIFILRCDCGCMRIFLGGGGVMGGGMVEEEEKG